MAEARSQRPRQAYRWGMLLFLAVALTAGLVALPKGQPSSQTARAARIQPAAGPLHTLSLPLSAGHGAVSTFTPYSQLVPADAPKIYASSAYLMDPVTGEVFYSNNALNEVPMASTTKIMTAIVAMTFGKPGQKITIGQDAIEEQNGENSIADLTRGDVLTLKDLLYALMLPSGDDAAVAIADGVAGSQPSFVRMMNFEAALLGLDHTHYTNVHGLDAPGHYTTVGDLARIARIAIQNFPLFAQIVKTPTYVVSTPLHGQYTWQTTN